MDIEYKGANCVVISTKNASLVVDGKLSTAGLKDYVMSDNTIELATQDDLLVGGDHVVIDTPGEYEVSNVSIAGISAKRLIDFDGQERSTIYKIRIGDLRTVVLGHVVTPLSDDQLESLGVVDVLIIPVGGGGYTLDSHQAVEVINKIDPKVVIPTHYADSTLKYEVPQESLESFVKELGAPQYEKVSKWKIKGGAMPEGGRMLVEISRTA